MAENLYNYILSKKNSVRMNYNLTSRLTKDVLNTFKLRTISPDREHFTVIELCTPLNHYLQRTHPEIDEIHPEIKKIMEQGKIIHKNAERWVEQIDNSALVEFYFDGSLKGINVSGKFDAKIGDSFIEFKSKIYLPENKEDAVTKYPQDFEQLVMYTVLDSLSPKVNYLVFISQKNPVDIKSFKVTITNEKAAKKFFDK